MTRLVLLQLSSTKQYWETHWIEKMGFNANIKLTFLGVTVDKNLKPHQLSNDIGISLLLIYFSDCVSNRAI